MQKLMISLDNNILNKDSIVAGRMIEYGKKDELFILIPDKKKEKFDLSENVHVFSTGGNKFLQYFRLKKMGKKIISDFRFQISDSLITTQDPFFTGLAGTWLKKKTGIKLEVQMHGDFFGGYYKGWKLILAKYVLKRADKIRVAGERIKNNLLTSGISEEKIEIKSIEVERTGNREQGTDIDLHEKYFESDKIFLVLGRLDPVKNITWLVDVFAEVAKQKPDYLLLIVGRGNQEKDLKTKVKNLKLENNIKFEPWTESPHDYERTADCVVFPSLSEGYGLVPMEAFGLGTPVIMNDVGVANYELPPSDKVKILKINDKEAWKKTILEI